MQSPLLLQAQMPCRHLQAHEGLIVTHQREQPGSSVHKEAGLDGLAPLLRRISQYYRELGKAAKKGDEETVRTLLQRGAHVEEENPKITFLNSPSQQALPSQGGP